MKIQRRMRADFKATIVVKTEHKEIVSGNTRNISLNGVLIESQEHLTNGEECIVQIILNGMTPPLTLEIKGEIARNSADGFAVHFEEMDVETLHHLKQIVLYNTDDPDGFIEESNKKIGFK